ncbi:MAG: zinc-binding dehydrogenase [Sedimenticolaceae bacterium]
MLTIKAAVCLAFNEPLKIEEVELRAPVEGEVQVKLEACAVCHSDITFIEGGWGGSLPAVYGHEAAGRVVAIGSGVQAYAVGDAVIVTLIRSCGTCLCCTTGAPVLCEAEYNNDSGPLSFPGGGRLQQGLAVGGFAEQVVVDQSQLAAIPSDVSMVAASLLSCGVITGVGAVVNTAGIRPGQTVVVIGAGGVGLNAIQGARIAGARHIIAIDMNADKLTAAKEFGATDSILATEEKPWKTVHNIVGRGVDAVFITVGAISIYDTAPRYLAPGGKLIMVGMPHTGEQSNYEPVVIAALGQSLIGTKMGDTVLARDIPWLVDLYQQGRLKLDELVSRRWPLEQINEAIADTSSGAARRNVIVF